MLPRKLKIAFGFMPYGGNGGTQSEIPDIRNWLIPTVMKIKGDDRCDGEILYRDHADVPLTMVRNELVGWARESKADILVMVDSDNAPDVLLGIDNASKPFWDTSFDYIYRHYEKGPVMIGAPYCGPPMQPDGMGSENVYVFVWRNYNTNDPGQAIKLDQFTREEAASRTGIEPVAALPTGCIMIDVRCFDLIDHPYFDYEYEGDGQICDHCGQPRPGPRRKKCSTEDVVTTRNISMAGCAKLGYNPVLCNWDAWAGHWKPLCVAKPRVIAADYVSKVYLKALADNIRSDIRVKRISPSERLLQSSGPVTKVSRHEGNGQNHDDSGGDSLANSHNTPQEDLQILRQLVGQESAYQSLGDDVMTVVELGSWTGQSAQAIAETLDRACRYNLYCVDHWKGGSEAQRKDIEQGFNPYETFCKRMKKWLDKTVFTLESDTVEMGRKWTIGPIDILFIDADHTYEGCKADIKAWSPHVKEGGLIMGHDYNSLFPGVKRAVHEIFGYDVAVIGNMWVVRRAWETNLEGEVEGKAAKKDGARSGTAG
jgi:predicted O-methyltransferase YrrM